METSSALHKRLLEVCDEHKLLDPTTLLIGLTNGKDLRKTSLAYEWVLAFEEEHGDTEVPTDLEFELLKEIIKEEGRNAPVTLDQSIVAQKTLLEYVYPKRKSVDVTQNSASNTVTPLRPSEIRRFERKFNKHC